MRALLGVQWGHHKIYQKANNPGTELHFTFTLICALKLVHGYDYDWALSEFIGDRHSLKSSKMGLYILCIFPWHLCLSLFECTLLFTIISGSWLPICMLIFTSSFWIHLLISFFWFFRSLIAAYLLVLNGYKNVFHLDGGLYTWFKEGLPTVSEDEWEFRLTGFLQFR